MRPERCQYPRFVLVIISLCFINDPDNQNARYAIDNSSMDWSTAETQVAKIAGAAGKKSHQTVVSIKSVGSKRKASDTGDDGAKGVKKPTRRGKTAKR